LHRRALKRRWYEGCDPVTYAAFDLMMKDGVDLRGRPLVERKALLRELLAKAPGVLYVSDLPAEASLFAQAVLPLKLEGFIAKRKDSQYTSGLSPHWIKIKRPGWQEGRTWRN
jgi:bifunctional non-homologous end joining protein LigD